MGITISDGINTVDISKASVTKSRIPRVASLSAPNTPSDILQTFNSEGFALSIEGDWVTAPSQAGQTDPDYRAIMEAWRRANVALEYTDGQLDSWFTLRTFTSHLTPGQPGAAGTQSTVIHYSIELTESLRPSGRIDELPIVIGGTGQDLPTEGTFTTWSQTWTLADSDATSSANYWIDEVNLQLWILNTGFVKARSLTTGAITFAKNTNLGDPQDLPANDAQIASIQRQYILVRGKPGSAGDTAIFSIMKNGATLFTPGSDVSGVNSISVLIIAQTGKYVCLVDNANNIYLWTGS